MATRRSPDSAQVTSTLRHSGATTRISPSATWCGEDFLRGASPANFANEGYEVQWTGWATLDDLNARGRGQLGLSYSADPTRSVS